MSVDVEKLRTLAEKASPGPWEWVFRGDYSVLLAADGEHVVIDDGSAGGEYSVTVDPASADGRYIAAASPDCILELLDELQRARAAAVILAHAYEHDTRPPSDVLEEVSMWKRAALSLGENES